MIYQDLITMHDRDLALMEHTAKAVNMIRDSIYGRKSPPRPEEPKSDCCEAAMERVGDECYTCAACGRLCSDSACSL